MLGESTVCNRAFIIIQSTRILFIFHPSDFTPNLTAMDVVVSIKEGSSKYYFETVISAKNFKRKKLMAFSNVN